MQFFLGVLLVVGAVSGSKNRPTVSPIENNPGITFEEVGKVKIINDPFTIFTLVDIKIIDEVFLNYVKGIKGNVSNLVMSSLKYTEELKRVTIEENENFSKLINETHMQFTKNPRALFFVNEAQRNFRSAHAELQVINTTIEDTLKIAKEFDYLASAMGAIARRETPKEFFNRIDWVRIKNHLGRFLGEELLPVDQCNFVVDFKVVKLNNRTLAFMVNIPTIQKDEYTLYKLHRMPSFINIGNNYVYTRTLYNNDYLGVDKSGHRTFFLSEQEKGDNIECRSENIYLRAAPVISLEVNCETELLLHNTMSCPREEDFAHESVLEVVQGGLLYSMAEETKAKIKCTGYSQVKKL